MSIITNKDPRAPNHPMLARIQQYIERLRHSLVEAFDESSRKRSAPSEPTDGLSDAKRQRLGAEVPLSRSPSGLPSYPSLPPGPVSFAQLFTLTQDQGATSFDVKAIPIDLVRRIVPLLLQSIDRPKLDHALNVRVFVFHRAFHHPLVLPDHGFPPCSRSTRVESTPDCTHMSQSSGLIYHFRPFVQDSCHSPLLNPLMLLLLAGRLLVWSNP